MKGTGYQIQDKAGYNLYSDDQEQLFDTLDEARSWADAIWESLTWDADEDEEPQQKKDCIIAYYENGVNRGEYPLFPEGVM